MCVEPQTRSLGPDESGTLPKFRSIPINKRRPYENWTHRAGKQGGTLAAPCSKNAAIRFRSRTRGARETDGLALRSARRGVHGRKAAQAGENSSSSPSKRRLSHASERRGLRTHRASVVIVDTAITIPSFAMAQRCEDQGMIDSQWVDTADREVPGSRRSIISWPKGCLKGSSKERKGE